MTDCTEIIETVESDGECPQNQATAATCISGNTDSSLGEAWDKVKEACGEDSSDSDSDTTDKGDVVTDVLSACAQTVEDKEFDSVEDLREELGTCVDDSILSEEEGGFQLTEKGEELIG